MMLLRCNTSLAESYTSGAQKSRILSESWFESNGYRLSCDGEALLRTRANTQARDFLCPQCDQS